MNTKMNVTLILADRVRDELKLLDRAENDRDSPSKSLAIAVAMKGVREALSVQVMNNPSTVEMTDAELELCKRHFRDVGENTFVFEPEQKASFDQALKKVRSK